MSVDYLSDAFVDAYSPLDSLVKVAQEGDRKRIGVVAEHFQQHAHTMLKVSNMQTQDRDMQQCCRNKVLQK